MRFDLEIVESERLTSAGKAKLAKIFYDDTYSDNTAFYNSTFLQDESILLGSKFNLEKNFKELKNIDPTNFTSKIDKQSEFLVDKLLIKRGGIIPFLTSGSAYFHKYKASLSNNNVKMIMTYNSEFMRYEFEVPDEISFSSIEVFTSRVASSGVIDIDRTYEFVNNNINIIVIEGLSNLPAIENINTVIIVTTNGIATGLYGAIGSTKVKEIVSAADIVNGISLSDWNTKKVDANFLNGMCYIDAADKKIFIKQNNVFYNYIHKLAFNSSKKDYKFIVEIDTYLNKRYLYLNSGLEIYSQNISETVRPQNSKVVFLDKFPIQNISMSLPNGISYKYNDGSSLSLLNTSASSINVSTVISYNPVPIISFNRKRWDLEKDIKHIKADLSPRAVNFMDGTICMISSDGDKSAMVGNIDIICDSKEILPFSSKKITVKVTSITGLPLSNKKVDITIPDNIFGDVKWATSDTSILSGVTNLKGEFSGLLLNDKMKLGSYVAKEWVGDVTSIVASGTNRAANTNNKIYLPFEITSTAVSGIGLFFVLGDDPLIGQIKNSPAQGSFTLGVNEYALPSPYDYFSMEDDIDSYILSGRKIAYVGLSAINQGTSLYKVSSSFIRPSSVNVITAQKDFFCRDLFIYNSTLAALGKASGTYKVISTPSSSANFTNVSGSNITISQPVSAWNQNWLLTDNQWKYFKARVQKYTEITFAADIPGISDKNVLGYFLRIQKQNPSFEISASSYDNNYNTLTSTSSSGFSIRSVASTGESFSLATNPNTSINSYIGPYSYLTLSDYLISPEGTNYTRYICKHSQNTYDHSENRCNHGTLSYRNYYVKGPDSSSNLYCMHNVEYDKNPTVNDISGFKRACPGLDAQLINPFVLYTS